MKFRTNCKIGQHNIDPKVTPKSPNRDDKFIFQYHIHDIRIVQYFSEYMDKT